MITCKQISETLKYYFELEKSYPQLRKPSNHPYLAQSSSTFSSIRCISTRSVFTLSFHLNLGLPTICVAFGLSVEYLILATCTAHLSLRNFIILLIFSKVYRLRKSTLCNFFLSQVF